MPITVSIVEDNEELRGTLARMLNKAEGFSCISQYPNAEVALEGLPNDKPQVVLMDINLPGINGVECVRKLKQIAPEIPAVMLTAYEDTENIFAALAAGATGYLLKRAPRAELLDAIREVHRGGSPMTTHIARKVVQSFQRAPATPQIGDTLSAREQEVLDHLSQGFLYKEIAEKMGISYETVHTYIRRIYEKLQGPHKDRSRREISETLKKVIQFGLSWNIARLLLLATLLICSGFSVNCNAGDLPILPFTSGGYEPWKATGTAFRLGPASGDWLPKLEIENARDSQVISSEMEGDAPTGTLTSTEFTIKRKYISFLIGGGDYERDTCLNLLVDGNIVRSATGWRSDHLAPASWDVTRFSGRRAQVEVVDQASGDWGHINVDQIVQTDNPERLPVVTEPLYGETLRPQFHFTARQWTMDRLNPQMRQEGWINDLNGLIFYDGEYHLFAQRWAKCWLHAVSRDLIHWTELEPAFWEEKLDSGVQSGTCVIDYNNTSGLSPNPATPPMIAFWPRFDNQNQCLSYSLDHGRTWKPYVKNPILTHPERDPKVFWYAPGNHWVMILYGDGQYHILTSTNLLSWKDEHHPIPNSFECPDFFQLPVDGDHNNMKWVLIQGNGQYSIGDFNGVEFKNESERHPCDVGPNFYATQTWANTDTGDGRRIQVAWMHGSTFPDMPFNQEISFPCELKLRTTANGLRIFREPISEIDLLHRGKPDTWTNRTLKPNEELRMEPNGRLFQIHAEVNIPDAAKLTFNIRGVPIIVTAKTLVSGHKPVAVTDNIKTLEILVDRASIETFVNQGEISSTRFALPNENGLSMKAEGESVQIQSLVVYPLNSAWTIPQKN